MHVLMVNNIYPPIMAGGAELVVADLVRGSGRPRPSGHRRFHLRPGDGAVPSGIAQRRHRHSVLPTQRLLEFRPPGRAEISPGACGICAMPGTATRRAGFARCWTRRRRTLCTPICSTDFRRRSGIARGAPAYRSSTPRTIIICCARGRFCSIGNGGSAASQASDAGCIGAWHLRTAALLDLFVSPSRFLLEQHRDCRASGRGVRQWCATAFRCRKTRRAFAPPATAAGNRGFC